MKQQREDQVIPYSKSRRFMREAIRSTHHKPMMHGLLEVDVTKARACLRAAKGRTGESPSFTAFIIGCLGRAVDEHPYVHALWKGRHHVIQYRDVDVLTGSSGTSRASQWSFPASSGRPTASRSPRSMTRSGPPRSRT
jgi:pyruvate/2-oxoglutarate dehydrogenase complex dihydrolipoamide acyltransferase (E2) component